MIPKYPFNAGAALARISIWTIVHHDWLAAQTRFYVWCACALILFLSIASVISLQTALYALLVCGLGLLMLLWSLINWRGSILLAIRDEKLKLTAHAAMLNLIHSRQTGRPVVTNRMNPRGRWVKKKSHS